jgi:hypothetical protein
MRLPRQRHRIWGFGPAGWALVPVLAALIWTAATGYDLRHQVLRGITALFGPDVLYAVVGRTLPGWSFSILGHQWGPTALCVALLALHAAPRRPRPWGYLLLASSAVIAPTLPWLFLWGTPPFQPWPTFGMVQYAAAIGAAACFALATGSVKLGAAIAALTAGGIFAEYNLNGLRAAFSVLSWSGYAWHALLGAVIAGWAVLERRAIKPEYACQFCGYDLRDLPAATSACPECGRPAPAATTAA